MNSPAKVDIVKNPINCIYRLIVCATEWASESVLCVRTNEWVLYFIFSLCFIVIYLRFRKRREILGFYWIVEKSIHTNTISLKFEHLRAKQNRENHVSTKYTSIESNIHESFYTKRLQRWHISQIPNTISTWTRRTGKYIYKQITLNITIFPTEARCRSDFDWNKANWHFEPKHWESEVKVWCLAPIWCCFGPAFGQIISNFYHVKNAICDLQIERQQFEATINKLNEYFAEAEKGSCSTYW